LLAYANCGSQAEPKIEVEVSTAAKISLGDDADDISQLLSSMHFMEPRFWRLMPSDVDSSGNIYVLTGKKLYVFSSGGRLVRKVNFPWIWNVLHVRHGTGQTLWVAEDVGEGLWSRLVKAREDGKAVWEIGQRCPGTKPKRTVPQLPHPPRYSAKADNFLQIEGLFAASCGDIFVLPRAEPILLRRFNPEGRLLASYDVYPIGELPRQHPDYGVSFSALAARDGTVYSHLFTKKNDAGWLTEIIVYRWVKPNQRTTRTINLSQLGYVPESGILLAGVDKNENLYFQYIYSPSGDKKDIPWTMAMAIAKVGSDGKAEKIFDIYEHYKREIENAVQQANQKRKKRGIIGIGDVIHVAVNGDLYLEIATSTHYRIDKIVFSQK
jgi:hypothetical protein